MRLGIDTYSFHRYLGEVYPVQQPPDKEREYVELVKELSGFGIDGLSIETCFLSGLDDPKYEMIADICRDHDIEMILAWGHPFGLYGGTSDEARDEMLSYLDLCARMGITTMRIVGSNRRLMGSIPKKEQLKGVERCLERASSVAEKHKVTLAIENHQDFTAGELLDILEHIGSGFLGINYDSGNSMRIGEDPVQAAALLGSWIKAVHLKDAARNPQADKDNWIYWACVPAGKGELDLVKLMQTIENTGFSGVYALELDYMHPDYPDEMHAIVESLKFLRHMEL